MRLVLIAAMLTAAPAGYAQTLPARPVPLNEPVRGGTWKDGELVLGKTTLASARRMLNTDTSAARKIPAEHAWEVGGVTLRPRYSFDPGKAFYQLYFDDNERLIYMLDRNERPEITKVDLLARYPRALRVQSSDSFEQFQVDVQPCVTLTALIDRKLNHVMQFGYAWTCRTKSLAMAVPSGGRTTGGK
jgi:hypothetical protein